jgi:hypothetical protein
VGLIGQIATEAGVFPGSDYVLITNGSLVHLPRVQDGLRVLNSYQGQVWFKFDSATEEGRKLVNNASQNCQAAVENLLIASQLCLTKLQTCVFDFSGRGLPETEKQAYLDVLRQVRDYSNVRRIMLYTIARPSAQPEANQLTKLPEAILENFAEDIRKLGFDVSVSV